MNMIRRLATSLLTLCLVMITTVARADGVPKFEGWQPSDHTYYRLDKPGSTEQMLLKTLRTSDGKTILTWLRPAEGVVWSDPSFGFFLHLQIFDTAGNALLGDEGLIVSDKPTATFVSDYGLALAPNGDILIAFSDVRNDAEKKRHHVFVYRYDQQGQPVWSADGVKMNAKVTQEAGSQNTPSFCVSGDNVYLSFTHVEEDSENIQVVRLNDDGATAWDDNLLLAADMLTMQAASDGDVYLFYNNDSFQLLAQRLNRNGQNVWSAVTTVEEDALSGEVANVPAPLCAIDEEGGVVLAYRKLLTLSGYQVYNRLSPDGSVLSQAVLGNGSTDGDAGTSIMNTKSGKTLIAWRQETEAHQLLMYMNLFHLDGSYAWSDNPTGIVLDAGSEWDYRPVSLIPQTDGWVLLYGDGTEWNTANFIACKIDDQGETIWRKQLAEGDFRSSGFSVVYDDTYAYIFFTREAEYNGGVIDPDSGGMFVMCVDISNAGNPSGIQTLEVSNAPKPDDYYDLNGRRLSGKPSQKGIYIQKGTKHMIK